MLRIIFAASCVSRRILFLIPSLICLATLLIPPFFLFLHICCSTASASSGPLVSIKMGSGTSMFNIFDNGNSCSPFVYGRGKMQKIHSVSTIDGPEDGGRISDPDGYLWVQSPSFRDYCLVHCDSDGSSIKNINAGKRDGKKEEKATHSEEAVLVCTDEVCTMRASRTDPTSVNKERRERRFRNVLPHRPGGMKNILKVHGHGKVPGKIVRASD